MKTDDDKAPELRETVADKIAGFLRRAGWKWMCIFGALVILIYFVPASIFSSRGSSTIPGENRLDDFFANQVYRPFFDKEFPYARWEDLHADPDAPHDYIGPRLLKQSASDLTPDTFKTSVLSEMGLAGTDEAEAKRKIDDRVVHFEAERWSADRQDVRLYFVLFKTTDDAVHFLELAKNSLRSAALPASARDAILNKVYVKRLANFVAIGVSPHEFRATLIWERFGIDRNKNGASDLHL